MAQSDAEALAGPLDKDEGRASPCTPSTPSVCSPPSAASSVPSAGKNICSSCGLEILDRYLLKVNNLIWHVRCLECSVCRTSLRQQNSCYIKNKEIFCKMDYFRLPLEEMGTRGQPLLSPSGNGLTLEGAVPSEQDSQPKPAKRARTSFTAEQLQANPAQGRRHQGCLDLLPLAA
ncbi:hypothetical protein E2I00_015451 [Balaenoptera physalus]|uniref:LIM zinc-binding domain-containing protein n=1 Tax=Balaenoptera physalus TaxID=9770 RepID=A0A6A1Q0J3_BALPH|nr:hypothetical protein E2I00_015451 [Balaenoptera physalus]